MLPPPFPFGGAPLPFAWGAAVLLATKTTSNSANVLCILSIEKYVQSVAEWKSWVRRKIPAIAARARIIPPFIVMIHPLLYLRFHGIRLSPSPDITSLNFSRYSLRKIHVLKLSGVSAPCAYVVNIKLRACKRFHRATRDHQSLCLLCCFNVWKVRDGYTEIPPGLESTSRIIAIREN
jgi:hypothetical protein